MSSKDGETAAGGGGIRHLGRQRPLRVERLHVASLIVGLNDTLRSGWDPAAVRAELLHAAGLLAAQGALLLTVRFHDHSRVFGLPRLLARPLQRRIDDLDGIYDEIHGTYDGLQVDLAAHPGVYDPRVLVRRPTAPLRDRSPRAGP